jgi:hypothetical protein
MQFMDRRQNPDLVRDSEVLELPRAQKRQCSFRHCLPSWGWSVDSWTAAFSLGMLTTHTLGGGEAFSKSCTITGVSAPAGALPKVSRTDSKSSRFISCFSF